MVRSHFTPPHTGLYRLFPSEFRAWDNMRSRCYNPNATGWKIYGGRGIRVCDRWRNSFRAFLSDMGPKPTSKHSLDRINVNRHYQMSNCRWATWKTQSRNQRRNHLLTLDGMTLCFHDWARKIGISPGTLQKRLAKGWSLREALYTPPLKKATRRKGDLVATLVCNGETRSIGDWSRLTGTPYATIKARLHLGWTVHKALHHPIRKLRKRSDQ